MGSFSADFNEYINSGGFISTIITVIIIPIYIMYYYTDLILVLTISVSSTAIRNTVHWSETAVGSGTTIICTKSACETHPNGDEVRLIYYLFIFAANRTTSK